MSNPDVCVERPRSATPPGDFRVDGWLVEPSLNRLVKGGTVLRVRPQLIDMLACLAGRPGQVVSKAALLAEVWSDRFVAESGISRCVAELRQLLEDDAREPRVIETIPKRGYRLIARVERAVAPQCEAPHDRPAMPDPPPGPRPRSLAGAATTRGFLAVAGMLLAEIGRHLGRKVAG